MDPLTHGLAGVIVGGLFQTDTVGQATVVLAALVPDAEFVTRRIPRTAFLDYHHGVVHALPGAAAAALILAAAVGLVAGRPWISLLPLTVAGVASHIGLDLLMHNNGIALLAPFSRRRFSFPLVLGLNPVTASVRCRERAYATCLGCQLKGLRHNPFFLVFLVAATLCIVIPSLGRAWAILSLSVIAGFALNSNTQRVTALGLAGTTHETIRRKAFPACHSLTRWLVVAEEPHSFRATLIDTQADARLWVRSLQTRPPPLPVLRSLSLVSVRGFRNSVMFPYWIYDNDGGMDHVTWQDLSYLFSEDVDLYTLHVRMDAGGAILQNEFHERW